MRIAIPVFGTRVAPRFDFAPALLQVTVEERSYIYNRITKTIDLTLRDRINLIRNLDVEVLICGGVDQHTDQLLSRMPLQLYTWVTGEIEDAIRQYLSGRLRSRVWLRPARNWKRRRRGGSRKAEVVEIWQQLSWKRFSPGCNSTVPSLEAEGQEKSEILYEAAAGARDGKRA
jgi:predicted Fe-Mo cluster-binding NifX family protein